MKTATTTLSEPKFLEFRNARNFNNSIIPRIPVQTTRYKACHSGNNLKQIGGQTQDRHGFYSQAKASLLQKIPGFELLKLLQSSYGVTNHSHHTIILHHSSDTNATTNDNTSWSKYLLRPKLNWSKYLLRPKPSKHLLADRQQISPPPGRSIYFDPNPASIRLSRYKGCPLGNKLKQIGGQTQYGQGPCSNPNASLLQENGPFKAVKPLQDNYIVTVAFLKSSTNATTNDNNRAKRLLSMLLKIMKRCE